MKEELEDYLIEFSRHKLFMDELFHNIIEYIDTQSKNSDKHKKVDRYNFSILDVYFKYEYASLGLLYEIIGKIEDSKKPMIFKRFKVFLFKNFAGAASFYRDNYDIPSIDECFERYAQTIEI